MKNAIRTILLLVLITLAPFSACTPREQSAARTTPVPEVSAAAGVTKAPEPTEVPTEVPTEAATDKPTDEPTEVQTEVQDLPDIEKNRPIIATNILLYGDAFKRDMYGARPHELALQLQRFPTDKRGEAEMKYLIYDIEDGWRGYVFYGNFFDTDIVTRKGFALLVGRTLHSYNEFESLSVGDSITKVEAVDAVAGLYDKLFTQAYVPEAAKESASYGYPITSMHYLSDGILKIEYEMLEDKSLIISNIVYAPDYTLEHTSGDTMNYRIEPIDLPEK